MKWAAIALCIMLLLSGPTLAALAQATSTPTATSRPTQQSSSCSLPFNPCGALPFSVPQFATISLASPTAIPTLPSPTPVPATVTPSQTPTPTYTLTPTDTPTGTTATPAASLQAGGEGIATLSKDMGDLASTLAAQTSQQVILDGTVTGPEQVANQLGSYAGALFGIVKSFQELDSFSFGLISFLLTVLAFVLIIIVSTTIGGILLAFMRLLLQIWQSVKPL